MSYFAFFFAEAFSNETHTALFTLKITLLQDEKSNNIPIIFSGWDTINNFQIQVLKTKIPVLPIKSKTNSCIYLKLKNA